MFRLLNIIVLASASVSAAVPDFSRDVLPILSENCFHCHGQDEKARKADLRLDVEAAAKKKVDGVAPVEPGKSSASSIIERMISHDPEEVMPPPKSNRKVTAQQIEIIRQWIDAGAKWGKHWAFTRIEKPAGKPAGIDALVAAKLAERGLKPSPPAEASTLLRRVTLDLNGVPPTTGELDAFEADVRVRGFDAAYASVVERLMASPKFGERWVWEWLDAARYADSNGYQGDNDRTMWPWRDWVISALNTNMPYDQFTVWQLAGDLLPNATKEQKLGTAFVRNHMINGEGGRIAEENRIEYLFDQTETVGTVWLGLTLQCTRCHDHKFDPLTMRDYYSLLAFFNTTPVDGQGRGGQTPPILDISTKEEERRAQDAAKRVEEIAKEVTQFELKKFPRPKGKGLEASDAIKLPGNLPSYIAKTPPARRTVDPLLEAVSYFKDKDPAYTALLEKALAAAREKQRTAANVTKVMIMQERPEGPRDTFMLVRGAYDAPTKDKVSMATPASLPAPPADAPKNRLGLARWLVARDNPLTARVTVNRFWQSLFGVGLVKTAEDFGVQGERPVHMDLLDWLAADFMDSGWDVKHLIRQMVMSKTYRQSSRVTPELLAADPENRLIARGPRFRLPSFMLRDQVLALSGLLAPKLGGPPVKPYQPEGIWEEASFGKIKYTPDKGESLYRRTLYTFWRRIVGPTMIFDNAARQTCVVKASRTNTPLHALVTLNETTYVEAARVLAQRLLADQSLLNEDARLRWLMRHVTLRQGTASEQGALAEALLKLRAEFAASRSEAEKLISVGDAKAPQALTAEELAAWTSVCLMVMNLDEVLTKE